MTKTNVPKLRFKGFSGEWKNDILENNVNFVQGNDGTDTSLPVLTISAGKGWMNQKDRFGTVLAGNELKNYTLLKKGQLSYNHGNSKLAEYGAVFCLRNYDKALVPRVYHSFELKNGDSNFIEKLFESKIPDRQLRKLITSGARMDGLLNINKKAFGSISLNFPSQYEQQKIGSFFARIDKIIELQTKKLEKLKKLKHGYLQKMFPQDGESLPRLRFSGFSGEWDNKRLDEIANRITRKNKNLDSELPLTISAQYGLIDQESFFNKKVASKDLSNYLLVMDGEFAYNKSYSKGYPFGTIKSLKKYKMGVVSNLYIVFSIKKTTSHSFMDSFFDSNHWHKEVSVKTTEGARNHGLLNISPKDFMGSKIFLPKKMEEQKKIGSFFSKLDELIKCEGEKLAELKEQKNAYLQKMFI